MSTQSINLTPPYMVHSDTLRALSLIKNRTTKGDRSNYNKLHLDFLIENFGESELILPAFNYDFPRTKIFDPRLSVSQSGQLTQYVLSDKLMGRTETPITSVLTKIPELLSLEVKEAYGKNSVFDYLYKNNGSVIFYGTDIMTCTYFHYVENQYGPPLYRYDKSFSGDVVTEAGKKETKITLHVRPQSLQLIYARDLLERTLNDAGVIVKLSEYHFGVRARDLSEVLGKVILKDPFYFLDKACREDIEGHYRLLGRRFLLEDFES